MNLLANPISAFRKKKTQVDLTMGSYEEGQSESPLDSKLTSGYSAPQDENSASKYQKWVKGLGYFLTVLSLLSGALAMIYLPFILLSPTKFCSLFSFSLATAGLAIWALKGRAYIRDNLLSGAVRYYTTVLVATNLLGLLAAYRDSGAVVCLAMAIAQFIALTYVLFSRLAYGKEFLDNFYASIGNFFRSLFGRLLWRRTN